MPEQGYQTEGWGIKTGVDPDREPQPRGMGIPELEIPRPGMPRTDVPRLGKSKP